MAKPLQFALASDCAALVEGMLCLGVRDLWPELLAEFNYKLDVERLRVRMERVTTERVTMRPERFGHLLCYDIGYDCGTDYVQALKSLLDTGLFVSPFQAESLVELYMTPRCSVPVDLRSVVLDVCSTWRIVARAQDSCALMSSRRTLKQLRERLQRVVPDLTPEMLRLLSDHELWMACDDAIVREVKARCSIPRDTFVIYGRHSPDLDRCVMVIILKRGGRRRAWCLVWDFQSANTDAPRCWLRHEE